MADPRIVSVKAPIRDLSAAELRAKLAEHEVDQLHRDNALTSFDKVFEHATLLRTSVAENRDALKWIAAISTAAFFFVSRLVAPDAGQIEVARARGPLLGELAFLLSTLGAATYLLVVDQRASRWMRLMFRYTFNVTNSLRRMDAVIGEMGRALDRNEPVAANVAFKEAYRIKEDLGPLIADEPPDLPNEGTVGRIAYGLCVGGLGAGLLLIALDQVVRFAF